MRALALCAIGGARCALPRPGLPARSSERSAVARSGATDEPSMNVSDVPSVDGSKLGHFIDSQHRPFLASGETA